MIATNQSQSQSLIACGVDPKTADMYLSINLNEGENYGKYSTRVIGNDTLTIKDIMRMRDHSPAWSLSALLSLLPHAITSVEGEDEYRLIIYPYADGWQIEYQYCEQDECHSLICFHSDNLIEACVKTVEWLTSNDKLNDIKNN